MDGGILNFFNCERVPFLVDIDKIKTTLSESNIGDLISPVILITEEIKANMMREYSLEIDDFYPRAVTQLIKNRIASETFKIDMISLPVNLLTSYLVTSLVASKIEKEVVKRYLTKVKSYEILKQNLKVLSEIETIKTNSAVKSIINKVLHYLGSESNQDFEKESEIQLKNKQHSYKYVMPLMP